MGQVPVHSFVRNGDKQKYQLAYICVVRAASDRKFWRLWNNYLRFV